MVLARWEKPIQDEAGNLITDLMVEVRDENAEGTPLATGLCSDRDGLVALGNPFSAPTGVVGFHAPGGCYSVRVYKAGTDQTFRFQPVGTAAERDIIEGTGDVSGPDDSVDGEVVLFSGTSGKQIKRGGLLSALWAAMIHAFTSKGTPVGADEIGILDSAASFVGKRLTLTNLTAFLKAYFDTLYKGISGSASTTIQYDANDTFLKAAVSGTRVFVELWGAGASGGRGISSFSGGGGGGGGYVCGWFTLAELPSSVSITIGAGGLARTVNGTAGQAGGNSTFGSLLTAYGGGPGGGPPSTPSAGGGSGAGQGAAGTAGNNTGSAVSGGAAGVFGPGTGGGGAASGAAGGSTYISGGGGGGNGGAGGDAGWGGAGGGGGNSSGSAAGGTSKFGGNGGAGSSGSTAATAGSVPGGGGGGSLTGNSGAGGGGRCRVTVW